MASPPASDLEPENPWWGRILVVAGGICEAESPPPNGEPSLGAETRGVALREVGASSPIDRLRSRAPADAGAVVLDHVSGLLRDDDRRVVAFIACGAPGTLVDRASGLLLAEIERADPSIARARPMALAFPPQEEHPFRALRTRLLEALDATPAAPLEHALRDVAPRPDASGDRTLLWLDWGTLGVEPRRPLYTGELAAWLDLCANVLAPSCPPEVRIVAFLALEVDPSKHGALAGWMKERAAGPGDARFEGVLLPAFALLGRDGVRTCLRGAMPEACPRELEEEVADMLLARTKGGYDEVAALLEEAQATSWVSLRRALRDDVTG